MHTITISPDDLATLDDVAALAGVQRATVLKWLDRHPDAPTPIKGRLWLLSEWQTWLRETGRDHGKRTSRYLK